MGNGALSQSLSASPLRPSCATCRIKMQLVSVAPHPDYGGAFEVHGFACERCGRAQNYTLRRRHATTPAAAQPSGDKRFPRVRRH